jgi:GNAT superfamily N-acetyltransferase
MTGTDDAQAATSGLVVRAMQRDELDVLVEWAEGEGWKPGVGDADVFWATDPDGFVAADVDGEHVGGGSIVSYGGRYGFMGFFLIRPDLRHQGLGRELWHTRKRLLLDRLDAGAPIEMDGVFDMAPFYEKGGFALQHADRRHEVVAVATPPRDGVVDLATVDVGLVDDYDAAHFPTRRTSFLRRWIDRPGGHAVGVIDTGVCRGFAVSRPCSTGHRIGPLFADDAEVADALFATSSTRLAGETVYLDVPEVNAAAVELAARYGMVEIFGCARMTLGPPPILPWHEIYGVTTFELG